MSIVHLDSLAGNTDAPLATLAASLAGDVGEPAMATENIERLLAAAVSDSEFRATAIEHLRVDHFFEHEAAAASVLQAVVQLNRDGHSVSIGSIRRHRQESSLEDSTASAVDSLTEGGLLDRLESFSDEPLSEGERLQLLRQFLIERDVLLPLTAIVSAPLRNSAWGSQNLAVDLPVRLQQAARQINEINTALGTGADWGAPEPLEGPALPPFPVDALPPVLREWVRAEAEATQTPVDLVAMLALTVVAAATARKIEVEARDGWREPVNIYALVVLGPGNRKSAVFRDAIRPLKAAEENAVVNHAPAVANYERQVRVLQGQLRQLEKRATAATDTATRERAMRDAVTVEEELNQLTRVVTPRTIVDDCTPEKLEVQLAEQGGRLAVMTAEGGGPLAIMSGRYSDEAKLEAYLKGHTGDDLRTDRLSRESVIISNPALTMALCVQPDVLHSLGQKTQMRGRGLLARVLFALPRSPIGQRATNPPTVPTDVQARYEAVIGRLCHLVRLGYPADLLQPERLQFDEEAREAFNQWRSELEQRMATSGDLAGIVDWAAKLPGAVARIAGLLHLAADAEHRVDHAGPYARDPEGPNIQARPRFTPWETSIDADIIQAAIRIADYLIVHAQRAFSVMGVAAEAGAGTIADAHCVIEWLRVHQRFDFTRTEVQQANRSRFPRVVDVDPVLELLELKRYIRPAETASVGPRGGRPTSPRYLVNPLVLANGRDGDN